ncbi:MAG: spore protease YyaC [Dethiobacter sp.]|jgi:putative sporulation protein YyaC|nr:spore protease YyaC [Dethiobacter sp.]
MSQKGCEAVYAGKSPVRLDGSDPLAVQKMKWSLQHMLSDLYKPYIHQLVVLCIGTDRSTGDALGPLTGTKLSRMQPNRTVVYGTLDDPVHAVNLSQTIEMIKQYYSYPLIIAVDACLGRIESVGTIDLGLGSLRPGAGVHKTLPSVGEVYISGIVNVGGFLEYFVLQNTRLSVVIKLAEVIARGLYLGLQSVSHPAETVTY